MDLLVLVHVNNTKGAFRHIVYVPFVILLGNFDDLSAEFVLRGFFFEFSHALVSVLGHVVIVFEIEVVLNCFFELFGIHMFPIIIIFNSLLLSLKNILTRWNILPWLPVALSNVNVLPFCGYSPCHYYFIVF